MAVDKPGGMLSVPSRHAAEDVRGVVGKALSEELGIRLWPTHRLDFEVSGPLLFAKNSSAHATANGWFERREVRKEYEALTVVRGESLELGKMKVWKSRLLRGKKRAYEKPFGKESVTEVVPIKADLVFDKNCLLWMVHPLTGRPHQIRFEFAKHGTPIWGDELYGSEEKFPLNNAIALRAVSLGFEKCVDYQKLNLAPEIRASGVVEWALKSSH